jgi:hypothetical protein
VGRSIPGAIADFLALAMSQLGAHEQAAALGCAPKRARNNVAHHDDLDERLHVLFLDAESRAAAGSH